MGYDYVWWWLDRGDDGCEIVEMVIVKLEMVTIEVYMIGGRVVLIMCVIGCGSGGSGGGRDNWRWRWWVIVIGIDGDGFTKEEDDKF
ncbi:hypothetical protein FRX31_018596 [Thalictrum thalictroides]|uniref:Uncharacterized protein n=1 Tax=Thalictrum thalictroides TaxID=46969 RepID=A0A7J6W425_THATH|nr:hypothetical protein FRX31_018596 [Thalictrum thalictroides]